MIKNKCRLRSSAAALIMWRSSDSASTTEVNSKQHSCNKRWRNRTKHIYSSTALKYNPAYYLSILPLESSAQHFSTFLEENVALLLNYNNFITLISYCTTEEDYIHLWKYICVVLVQIFWMGSMSSLQKWITENIKTKSRWQNCKNMWSNSGPELRRT